jgi:hypothetical protein
VLSAAPLVLSIKVLAAGTVRVDCEWVSLLLDLEGRPIIVSMIRAQKVRQRKQLGAIEVGMCWRGVRLDLMSWHCRPYAWTGWIRYKRSRSSVPAYPRL